MPVGEIVVCSKYGERMLRFDCCTKARSVSVITFVHIHTGLMLLGIKRITKSITNEQKAC